MKRGLLILTLGYIVASANAEDIERTYHVHGLFDRARVAEFQTALTNLSAIKLKSIDYDSAEAILSIDTVALLNRKKYKEEQLIQNLSQHIRGLTKGNFDLEPRKSMPIKDAQYIEIPVIGHDCRGCSFGAYRAVHKQPGVIRATCTLRDGHVKVWIDPQITDRAKLEAAMVKKKIQLPAK